MMTAELEVHRFPVSRVREWVCWATPAALGMVVGELIYWGSGPSIETVFAVSGGAVLTGLLEAVRPSRAVIVTSSTIIVPKGWAGAATLDLSEVDRSASNRLSVWQLVNGMRVIHGRGGNSVTLSSFVLGRDTVARILALVAA